MVELHRNTKIWLLVIGICIVAIIFFKFLIGIIILVGIVGGIAYIFYKGIKTRMEEFGRGEFKVGKNKGVYKRRIAQHPYPRIHSHMFGRRRR